jgi:vacuolar-type H+-ATPase subunit H
MEGQASARDSAQEKVGEATGQAKETAGQATEKARKSLQDQIDRRSTEAGEQVGSTAQDIRSVAEQLRTQDKEKPAQLAEQAADRVERVGDYLRDSDADRLLRDIEDFGRRQPWAVVAGGLALGFVASRFLKASSSRRYEAASGRIRPQVGNGTSR